MTTKAEWMVLAASCEGATGPDREIDSEIAIAVGAPWDYSVQWRGWGFDDTGVAIERPVAFPYTRSLDAITALIERELGADLQRYDLQFFRACEAYADIWFIGEKTGLSRTMSIKGQSPALALCAAFCRAMAERAE